MRDFKHIPKDKLDELMTEPITAMKDSISRAWAIGYEDAKEELLAEARALVKADKEQMAINRIISS